MKPTVFVLASLAALSASATWTLSTEDVPSGCSHVITDGNWKLGVTKIAEGDWRLGRVWGGGNGSTYIAGEGVLDLRNVAEETKCEAFPNGVILKSSNNGALEKNTKITEAWFPDSFETMLGNTFKEDTKLTNVVFGSGFKTIGSESFRGCSGLTTVVFNKGIETIGWYGFNGCSVLELDDFTFPVSVTTLGDHCFTGCKKITGTLTFPGVTTVTGTYQFEDCNGMTGFSAPLLCTIAEGMFNRCTALASASFSANLESIGANAFNNSGALVSFYPTTMPKLTTFGDYGLRGHRKLAADFDLSQSSLVTLGKQAFVDGENIGTVKLPESLTTLGDGCLAYNSKPRVVWFFGPPPTTVGGDALNFKTRGYLVVGKKYASAWIADSRVAALTDSDKALSDYPGLKTVQTSKGLSGTRPIGKWSTATGSSWHWVVEELPKGLAIYIM